MRLAGSIFGITLWVTSAFILLSCHQASASPLFSNLFRGIGTQNDNNNDNAERNAIEFSTSTGSTDNREGFLPRLKSTLQMFKLFFKSFVNSLNSSSSSSSTADFDIVENDPDFDFSYFDNLESNTINKRDSLQTTNSAAVPVNTNGDVSSDFPDTFDSVSVSSKSPSLKSVDDVNTDGDTSVNDDDTFSLNSDDAGASLVSVNNAKNSRPSSSSPEYTGERIHVNIPGIFNLDIGGSALNGPSDALVSVRTGAGGTRVRAPFVDVSV